MAELVKRDEHADGDDEAAQRPRKIKHPLPPAPAHVPSCRSRGSRRDRSPPNCAALLLPASFRSPAQSPGTQVARSEEHTSELQSLMRLSYAVLGLTTKNGDD